MTAHNTDDIECAVQALNADGMQTDGYSAYEITSDVLDAVSDRIAARAYDEGRTAGILTFQDDRYEQGQIDALDAVSDRIAAWLRARAADLGETPRRYGCGICGALVDKADVDKHAEWHGGKAVGADLGETPNRRCITTGQPTDKCRCDDCKWGPR